MTDEPTTPSPLILGIANPDSEICRPRNYQKALGLTDKQWANMLYRVNRFDLDAAGPSFRRLTRQPPAKTFGSTREAGRREVGREGLREFRRKRKENRP